MHFNVQLNYKIYNKNAVLCEAYPKDIRFFYTNIEGTSYGRCADFVKEPKSANIFTLYVGIYIKYKIIDVTLYKNAVLREAYPKDIRFFYTNTE